MIKKIALFSALYLLMLCIVSCKDKHKIVEPKEGPAHLVIQPTERYVGNIPLGSGVMEFEFAMINDGSEDLLIGQIENLCSCTHAEYVEKPISPGHGRTLKIFLDTGHLTPGEFTRTVIVHSNGGEVAIDLTGNRLN